ncbi:MAG: hypothetical protein LWX11_12070 [Firmicutes bacterium]|nr:hypothetical protein [Bacillota bacterium]
MAHDDHVHGPDCEHDDHEIEVVELEDESGNKEEYAILDELDFEGRHFCIMAPLEEVQAFTDGEETDEEPDLTIEIFEVKGDDFSVLEDEELAKRLMTHLDEISEKLEDESK